MQLFCKKGNYTAEYFSFYCISISKLCIMYVLIVTLKIMFKKLSNKIIRYFLISAIILITVLGLISYFVVYTNIYKNFVKFSRQNIDQSINSSQFFINSAIQSTTIISNNEDIINALESGDYSTIINLVLNNVTNSSFSIMDVIIYDTNENIYFSSNIASVPSLTVLRENQKINEFFESDQKTFLSVRTSQIFKIYDNATYSEEYGIISHIQKIFDNDNNLIGYVFIDINPKKLYDNFFSHNADSAFLGEAFIVSEGNYLKYVNHTDIAKNIEQISSRTEEDYKLINKYLVITKDIYTDYTQLITFVPMKEFTQNMLFIAFIIIVLCGLMIFASLVTARYAAKSIIKPLEKLVNKMQKSKL